MSTGSDLCDTVEDCTNGDATERRDDRGNQAAGTAFAEATAGQVRCLNTPLCMGTKPRLLASAQSCIAWWRRCSAETNTIGVPSGLPPVAQ